MNNRIQESRFTKQCDVVCNDDQGPEGLSFVIGEFVEMDCILDGWVTDVEQVFRVGKKSMES